MKRHHLIKNLLLNENEIIVFFFLSEREIIIGMREFRNKLDSIK